MPEADRVVPTVANFAELLPDHDLFPVQGFRESLERVLQNNGGKLLRYGQPTGALELRQLLAERDRDPGTDPGSDTADADEILVTNGAQQGIDLVLRAFTRPGDAVAVAIPTYHHLFGLLKAHGLHVAPLRAGPDGIDTDDLARALARPDVRLLYLMPTFHNPTGRTLDLRARESVMGLVRQSRVPVLEDESELELRFRGEALPSFRSLDPRGLTVTVRTFSKGLFPGVRLGWVHAHRDVLGPMGALKRYTDLETSPLLQAALVDFAGRGGLDGHLESLRAELGRRHRAAVQALHKAMPTGSSWSEPDGGFALWLEGPRGVDGRDLAARALARGVLVSPGQLFCPGDDSVPGMRLSLSRSNEAEIQTGIRVLGRCASELAAHTESPSNSPLFL
jgi:DNA-binding transcriptional MocR family regulator